MSDASMSLPRGIRNPRAALALLAVTLGGAADRASARIVVVQTPSGPVWTSVPEPAGTRLPRPNSRRLPYQQLIDECAARHGVDPRLVEAIIACESDFDPAAVSKAGAQGIMQLMPGTGAMYGLEDPFDATQNVDAGTRHLSDLLARFDGDWKLVAAAYNAGAGAVERHGGIPPYAETRHYVRKMHHYLAELGVHVPGVPAHEASGERIAGLSFVGGDSGPDPILDWKPAPEPEPVPEPPRRRGERAVVVRDASGRAVFTNRHEVKARAKAGAHTVPGAGAPTVPGAGAPTVPGAGAPTVPGAGAPTVPGAGAPTVPGPGAPTVPGPGAPTVPGAGDASGSTR